MEQLKLDIEDNVVTKFTMTPHLAHRMRQILSILRDRDWITVEELCALSGYYKQGSISALCRDLRKEKYGSHKVIGRYNKNKIYEYRLIEEDVT